EPDDGRVRAAYERLTAHPLVGNLIASLDTWPTQPLGKAYDPKDALWVLSMLADFGMRRDDPRIAAHAEIRKHGQHPEGVLWIVRLAQRLRRPGVQRRDQVAHQRVCRQPLVGCSHPAVVWL